MQIFKAALILPVCFLLSHYSFCQNFKQNIKGKIINSVNEQAVEGANITLLNTSPQLGTSSDKNGNFVIENVPVGRYTILVQHVAFSNKQLSNILVISAKENYLIIPLSPQSQLIKAVDISDNIEPIQTINTLIFTAEEVNRYAATFNDPARLATSLSGTSTVNDQSNHVSVQGNSPNANAWYLNGLAIANPNHLSNAGTFSDQPSTTGGGTNVLSAQLLSESIFHKGIYPLHLSNALGGVFDMHFRKGNSDNHHFAIQAGLIGLEVSAEGPFSKDKKHSFLANYRYSTVGLLTQAGVDFGDEEINYSDFSFNLNFELEQSKSEVSLFGLFGTSTNDHDFIPVDEEIESDKDLQEIYYDDLNTAFGITYSKQFNKAKLNLGLLASTHAADRNSNITLNKLSSIRKEEFSQDDATVSFSAIYTHYFNNNASLKIGNVAEYSENYILFTTLDSIQTNYSYVVSGENEMLFNSNFIQFRFEPFKKTYIDIGVKSIQHFTDHKAGRTPVTNEYLLERTTKEIIPVQPQVKFGFNIGKKQLIELNWQSNSQKQTSSALYSLATITQQNLKLESTQNNTYNILYVNSISTHSNFSSQLYFQDISNVPVAFNNGNHYSLLNNHAQIIDEALTNDGTGNNYGLDLSFQKTFSKQYYLLANTSLYESTFKDANNKTRSTTYDGRYLVNLTAGYEKPRRKNTNSFFGANIRVFNQGGYRHTPIDTAASHLANKTIYNNSEFNSLQYPDYFRVDVGIRFAKNKAKATRTWSIDIQNITNNNNVAYKYYDIYFKKIKTKYHLGIIPVFNYKIEF